MKLSETSTLLELVRAVDQREVDEAVVFAWHDVIGHLDYELARLALRDARANPDIQRVEPKHILTHAAIVKRRMDRQERVERAGQVPASPGSAPKPENFDDLVSAFQSGDEERIAHEVALYEAQLEESGYESPHPLRGPIFDPRRVSE